jgi:hypothetical protein
LALAACPSGPSSSAPDRTSEKEQASTLDRKIELIDGLMSQRFMAARILDDLAGALPERVRLTEVAYGSGSIEIKGSAPSNNLIADYVSRLEGSRSLMEVMLRSSVQKSGRNREFQEFTLQAQVRDGRGEKNAASGSTAERLERFEGILPPWGETSDLLRQIQTLAVDSGLQMTKFAPGDEAPGEFYSEWPIAIEVTGSQRELGRFLGGMADLPRFWLVKKFSFKAVSSEDAGSDVRASITAQTYFLR